MPKTQTPRKSPHPAVKKYIQEKSKSGPKSGRMRYGNEGKGDGKGKGR